MAKLRAMFSLLPHLRRLSGVPVLMVFLAISLPVRGEGLEMGDSLDALADRVQPLVYALSLIGTPYRLGGQRPETGLDCSGLVRHVYATTASLELPHSAAEISRSGEPVAAEQLQPGDLVFFNTRKRPFSHVGIYKGDGKFVHASSSRTGKVLVSDMTLRYWAQRFDGARRLPAR